MEQEFKFKVGDRVKVVQDITDYKMGEEGTVISSDSRYTKVEFDKDHREVEYYSHRFELLKKDNKIQHPKFLVLQEDKSKTLVDTEEELKKIEEGAENIIVYKLTPEYRIAKKVQIRKYYYTNSKKKLPKAEKPKRRISIRKGRRRRKK